MINIDTEIWIIILIFTSISTFFLGFIFGSLHQMDRDNKYRREREIQDRIIELERKVGLGKFKNNGSEK
jgi:hypothetical protein